MEQVTIGQIFIMLAKIAGVIGSVSVVIGIIVKFWRWLSKKEMNPILDEMAKMEKRIMDKMIENDTEINSKIDKLTQDVNNLDVSECKDVIVSFIAAIEDGAAIDAVFEERAYEAMDRYENVLHQNSYIHKRWEEVVGKKNIKKNIKE